MCVVSIFGKVSRVFVPFINFPFRFRVSVMLSASTFRDLPGVSIGDIICVRRMPVSIQRLRLDWDNLRVQGIRYDSNIHCDANWGRETQAKIWSLSSFAQGALGNGSDDLSSLSSYWQSDNPLEQSFGFFSDQWDLIRSYAYWAHSALSVPGCLWNSRHRVVLSRWLQDSPYADVLVRVIAIEFSDPHTFEPHPLLTNIFTMLQESRQVTLERRAAFARRSHVASSSSSSFFDGDSRPRIRVCRDDSTRVPVCGDTRLCIRVREVLPDSLRLSPGFDQAPPPSYVAVHPRVPLSEERHFDGPAHNIWLLTNFPLHAVEYLQQLTVGQCLSVRNVRYEGIYRFLSSTRFASIDDPLSFFHYLSCSRARIIRVSDLYVH